MTAQHNARPGGLGTGADDLVGAGSVLPIVATATHADPDHTPRCRVCRRPVTAATSIERGVGRDCYRRLVRSITSATGRQADVVGVGTNILGGGLLLVALQAGGAA